MQEKFKERDCMSINGFAICVKMDIKKRLGRNFSVKEESIAKNNGTKRKAVTIRELSKNVGLTIYLDGYYEAYRDGEPLLDIEERILQAYRENRPESDFDTDLFTDWKKAGKSIVYELINYDRNRKLLKGVPHRKFNDLAIVCRCFLGADGEGTHFVLINNSHLKLWGVTADEVHAAARQNTPELMGSTLSGIVEAIQVILGCEKAEPDRGGSMSGWEDPFPMYVLTNRYNAYGAACILYENILKNVADQWDDDICILPSSVHETILLPMGGAAELGRLEQMVREINRTQLAPDEVLSDNVYRYVRETGEIIIQEENRHE